MNAQLDRISVNPVEDVLAAIAYGAEVSRERIVPVPTEAA